MTMIVLRNEAPPYPFDLTTLRGVRPVPSLNARFWAKVDRSGECWLWMGRSIGGAGRNYGLFSLPVTSERGVAWRTESVHRLAFEATHGRPVSPGFDILHSCDHGFCIRPIHLREGTDVDNAADKTARDRHPRGGRVPGICLVREDELPRRSGLLHFNGKLADAEVVAIREGYVAGRSAGDLARQYKISRQQALFIIRGHSRRGAGGPVSAIRPVIGDLVPGAKLNAERVADIRRRYGAGGVGGETARALAKEYGITFQTISNIVRGKTWKHVR